MSDTLELNLREQVTRIDRSIEETRKFTAEQHKLQAEQQKLLAEQQKLLAETMKFHRERWLVVVALLGAVGGVIAGAATVLRFFGVS